MTKGRKTLITATIAVLIVSALMHLLPGGAQAFTLNPYYKEFLLEQGDRANDAFIFTNTSDQPAKFQLSVSGYDPRAEENADVKILVELKEDSFTIGAGEERLIPFSVVVTPDIQQGSYFNIIYLEQVSETPDGENSVGINLGFGAIVATHVVTPGGTVEGAFKDQTIGVTEVVSKGIPFLRPTQLKYTYANNSGFIFRPSGEIRIFDAQTEQQLHTEQINPDEELIFSGETYEQEFEVDLWNFENLNHGFKIATRTYNNLDSGYIDHVTEIAGFSNIIYVIIALIGLTALYIVLKILGWLFGDRKAKKASKADSKERQKSAKTESEKSKSEDKKSQMKSETP